MCESRATVLGSLIGDEEDSVKEINSSLTNSLRLVPPHPTPPTTPGRSASVTRADQKNQGEPRIELPLKTCGEKNNVRGNWRKDTCEEDSGSRGPGIKGNRRRGGEGRGARWVFSASC